MGRPKGVGITHTNALTYVHNLTRRLDFAPSDRFSQTFDLTFDLMNVTGCVITNQESL